MTFELDKVLEELGEKLGIPKLHIQENNTCLIKLENNVLIQVESDKNEGYLIVGSTIATLPPGRYKEDLFETALRTNATNDRIGIFAYSRQADTLILYDRIWVLSMNGSALSDYIKAFAAKVKLWQDAISHNDMPPVSGQASPSNKGIFGLRP